MRPITFDKTEKIFNKFNGLKEDIENKSDKLTESLPLFFRHMFIDGNEWYDEINRFDYLKKGYVTNEFGGLNKKFRNHICFCSDIFNESKNQKPISLEQFNKTVIIKINSTPITVQDFILGIAYNGPIHRDPSGEKGKLYELIYIEFLIKYLDLSADLLLQISKFYVSVFQIFQEIFSGKTDGLVHEIGYGPIVYQDGKMLDGPLYDKSYGQIPVIQSKRSGLRICIEIKFIDFENKENIILEYGHSKNGFFKISLIQVSNLLIFKIKINGIFKTMKLEIERIEKYQEIEIAVYPDGNSLIAKNRFVKDKFKFDTSVSLINGKVIIGADLSGSKFGKFQMRKISIHSIDTKNNFSQLFYGSLKRRTINHGNENIPFNQIHRPF